MSVLKSKTFIMSKSLKLIKINKKLLFSMSFCPIHFVKISILRRVLDSLIFSLVFLPLTNAIAQANPTYLISNYLLTQSTENEREKAQQLYLKGMEYYYGGEYKNAIRQFEQALEINPNYIEFHIGIGLSQSELGNHQAAIAVFNQILTINPNYYNAYYNRASNYKALGKLQLDLQDLTKTLQLTNNNHVSALINRANIYIKLKQDRQAKQDLDRAIALNPDEANAYFNRALVNLLLGNRKAAQSDLNRAEQLHRKDGNSMGIQQVKKARRSLRL